MEQKVKDILNRKLPDWAVKPHPTKTYLSVINPMAVIDVLNEAFGVGEWEFKTREVSFSTTDKKSVAAVHGTLSVPKFNIHIEQFGGSDNSDLGDALKGSATDALTKCASYLGVGASIYKGQGNVNPPEPELTNSQEAISTIHNCTTSQELTSVYSRLGANLKKDPEVIAKGVEMRKKLTV